MSLRLSQLSPGVSERKRSSMRTPRARTRSERTEGAPTDEWVRLDGNWQVAAVGPDLAPYLDRKDPTAMALAAWPAIGSADRLVTLMGLVRDGAPAVAMPAADGVGVVVVTSACNPQGLLMATIWRRAALVGSGSSPTQAGSTEEHDDMLTAVASVLSHDGIAPLRRATAFADAALAGDTGTLPAEIGHRIEQARSGVIDAADLVREIVATLRVAPSSPPGRCELSAVAALVRERCGECDLIARWDIAHGDVILNVELAVAAPVFAAIGVLAAALNVDPVFSRTDAEWTLSLACPLSPTETERLLRLGASVRDVAGRTIRPRLALAARQARANGWRLYWSGSALLLDGMCVPVRKDS